jgi:hypothetical protein
VPGIDVVRGVRPRGAGRPRGRPGPRRPGLGWRRLPCGWRSSGRPRRAGRGEASRSARCGGAGRTIRRPGASRLSVTVAETGHHRVRRRRGTAGVTAAGSVTAAPCAAAGLATAAPVSSAGAVTAAAAAGAVTAGRVTAASSGTAAAAMPAPSLAGWPSASECGCVLRHSRHLRRIFGDRDSATGRFDHAQRRRLVRGHCARTSAQLRGGYGTARQSCAGHQ